MKYIATWNTYNTPMKHESSDWKYFIMRVEFEVRSGHEVTIRQEEE